MYKWVTTISACTAACVLLTGCGTPGSRADSLSREGITIVSSSTDRESALQALIESSSKPTTILAGDIISIRRNYTSDNETFTIRADGTFAYPLAGKIDASQKTPEAIAETLEARLTGVLKNPKFTVNITESPGNRAYVLGEVKLPGFVSLRASTTLQQAIASQGGLLNTANDGSIALLRVNSENRYDLFLIDFETAFEGSGGKPIWLRSADTVYVAKSGVGRAIDFVDLYLNRLIPFNKGMSFIVYDVNSDSNR